MATVQLRTCSEPVNGQDTTVALLSGLFAGEVIWQRLLPYLAETGNPVYSLHRPLAAYGSTIREVVATVRAELDALPTPHLHLVTNSMGGTVGIEIARQLPERIASLTLSGTPGVDGGHVPLSTPIFRVSAAAAAQLADILFHDPKRIPFGMLDAIMPEVIAYRRNVVRLLQDVRRYDLLGALADLKVPVLAIYGDHDLVTPAAEWQHLMQCVPGGALVIVRDAGHCPQLEQPHAFAEALLPILRYSK